MTCIVLNAAVPDDQAATVVAALFRLLQGSNLHAAMSPGNPFLVLASTHFSQRPPSPPQSEPARLQHVNGSCSRPLPGSASAQTEASPSDHGVGSAQALNGEATSSANGHPSSHVSLQSAAVAGRLSSPGDSGSLGLSQGPLRCASFNGAPCPEGLGGLPADTSIPDAQLAALLHCLHASGIPALCLLTSGESATHDSRLKAAPAEQMYDFPGQFG